MSGDILMNNLKTYELRPDTTDEYQDLPPYPFNEKPAAKSSTSVMQASVCQKCGCKLDGKAFKKGCLCQCHKTGSR